MRCVAAPAHVTSTGGRRAAAAALPAALHGAQQHPVGAFLVFSSCSGGGGGGCGGGGGGRCGGGTGRRQPGAAGLATDVACEHRVQSAEARPCHLPPLPCRQRKQASPTEVRACLPQVSPQCCVACTSCRQRGRAAWQCHACLPARRVPLVHAPYARNGLTHGAAVAAPAAAAGASDDTQAALHRQAGRQRRLHGAHGDDVSGAAWQPTDHALQYYIATYCTHMLKRMICVTMAHPPVPSIEFFPIAATRACSLARSMCDLLPISTLVPFKTCPSVRVSGQHLRARAAPLSVRMPLGTHLARHGVARCAPHRCGSLRSWPCPLRMNVWCLTHTERSRAVWGS